LDGDGIVTAQRSALDRGPGPGAGPTSRHGTLVEARRDAAGPAYTTRTYSYVVVCVSASVSNGVPNSCHVIESTSAFCVGG
jgi:hypothetical protein